MFYVLNFGHIFMTSSIVNTMCYNVTKLTYLLTYLLTVVLCVKCRRNGTSCDTEVARMYADSTLSSAFNAVHRLYSSGQL